MLDRRIQHFTPYPAAGRIALAVAGVAGVFSFIVCVLLIAHFVQIRAADPLESPELAALRQQFADSAEADPAVVAQIRAMDLLARKAYFTSRAHLRLGGHLLLGGVIVLLAALKAAARCYRRRPAPKSGSAPAEFWGARRRAREAVAFTGVVIVTVALFAAYFAPLDIPAEQAAAAPETEPAVAEPTPEGAPGTAPADVPNWETMRKQWPTFRGPGALGVAYYDTAPEAWNVPAGEGVRWRVATELPGFNSPVVWGKRVFYTGADENERVVYCHDADSGELVWRRATPEFPGAPAEPPDVTEDTGYAAPTMALHGERAFAIFGTGDVVCYDFDGALIWGRHLTAPDNPYGHASSLIAWGELLLVQFDDNDKPRLMALEIDTGEEAWTVEREYISWASPSIIHTQAGVQLLLNSERDVDAYDPVSGKKLWTADVLDGEVAPSPAYGAGVVFVANEYAYARAVRLRFDDGTTTPEVLWEWDESLPEVASPVATDEHFYIATSMGEIVSLDIETGAMAWRAEYDRGFHASPILVGDRIYAIDLDGVAHIIRAGAEYELIADAPFGEPVHATPAFLDGRIYARTETELICIERTP